jgi:hypothetical protein
MASRILLMMVLIGFALPLRADEPAKWWSDDVEKALASAKANRAELEAALNGVPQEQRNGMAFLVANMPESDLLSLKADFLRTNSELAYKARQEMPWGKDIPEDVFLNNVLPYANIDEKRDPWRKEFFEMCVPLVKSCKTPSEAAQKLNAELFKTLGVKYAAQRKAPNFSPKESIAQGTASCTGLSIVLSDACRAVCVPARLVGTANWWDKRGNHTWIEIWDKGWHFTGACEPDPKGLDRGWFVADAAKAKKDSQEHAIYAASFRKSAEHFPLVWARNKKTVPSENVTDRYTKAVVRNDIFRLSVRVLNADKKRVVVAVSVTAGSDPKSKLEGKSHDESVDTNDFLSFELQPEREYVVAVGTNSRTITAGKAGESRIVDFVAPGR